MRRLPALHCAAHAPPSPILLLQDKPEDNDEVQIVGVRPGRAIIIDLQVWLSYIPMPMRGAAALNDHPLM